MPTPKQLYVSKLNEIARRYAALEDDTIRRSMTMLADLRKQIAGELATTDFQAYRLKTMIANLEQLIDGYQTQLSSEVRSALVGSMHAGGATVVEPLGSIGVSVALFKPSRAQINAVLDFSSSLVRSITDQVRSGIDTQVRLAVLGNKNSLDAMKAITQVLGVGTEYGPSRGRAPVVRGVAARSETILRSEMMRVFNLSEHSQQLATAQLVPELKKSWMATADSRTRQSHLRAHMKYRDSPIPIDEPFILTEDGKTAKLMYPLDPNAPPEFTISCRCRMRTVHPAVGVIGTPLDGRIAAEMSRRSA